MSIQFAEKETFDELISDGFVIVDFFSTTCSPCKMLSIVLEDIDAELPFIDIVKVNITDCPDLSERFHISAVPTLHFYKNGTLVEKHVGLLSDAEIREMIRAYLY